MKSEKETSLLVVDDNFDNRNILSRLLKKNNYNTFSAESGVEALSIIENSHIDLVFLDLMMPGMSGFEVLEEIRKTYHAWELPVIVVTARVDTDSIIEAFDKGANDFITKPIIFSAAIARAKNLLLLKALQEKMVDINSELEISVDQKNAELKVTISKLEQEISKGKVTEIALTEAKNKAENATRSRSDFLANMSHEIRTPLNAIIGFSDLLMIKKMNVASIEKRNEYLKHINESGHHLLRIINDILDLSKIESGQIDTFDEECDIIENIENCMATFTIMSEQAGVEIECNLQEMHLVTDERIFQQIVSNILSNAIKFTLSGGSISITNKIEDGFAHISISDTGIGMTDDELEIALEQFGQVQSTYSRNFQGTGLGLPLVSKFMDVLGGKMDITSQKQIGTTVNLSFPC